MMKALETSLVLEENFFANKFKPPVVWQAFHHYYPSMNESDMWGVAPHVDYGMVTMLQQDDVGGLEVEVKEGTWIEATPIPGENVFQPVKICVLAPTIVPEEVVA